MAGLCNEDIILISRMSALLVILADAAVDDLRRYRISNSIIFAGLMLSLAVAVETLILGSRDSGMGISKALGMVLDMFLGGIVSFAAAFVLYALKGIGAGDVKLYMVCGLLSGYRMSGKMLLYTMAAGVVIGIMEVFIRRKDVEIRRKDVDIGRKDVVKVWGRQFHASHYSLGILAGNVVVMLQTGFNIWGKEIV